MIWNKEEVNEMQTQKIRKNHMDILWHEYTDKGGEEIPVTQASLTEKASIVGRVGIMLLSCGTGAWRVRSSMNALAEEMGITCTADIGLMSIEYTCFDGENGFTQSLCLTNTGVNTSKLNRLEHFIREFEIEGKDMSGEKLHSLLDDIERIHGLYSPIALRICRCACMLRIYISSWGRSDRDVLCICRGRNWKLSPLQTDQTPFYIVLMYCVFCISGMFCICRSAQTWRNIIWYFCSARSGIYLCNALYHTGISVYYQWY